jgi:hypothetical protein
MHRYDLANFVAAGSRVGLRMQRELLRVQGIHIFVRFGGALGLFHVGSRFSAWQRRADWPHLRGGLKEITVGAWRCGMSVGQLLVD